MQVPTTQAVIDLCTSHGFAIAGVASAKRSVHEVELLQWLADEKQGEMEWMKRNVEVFLVIGPHRTVNREFLIFFSSVKNKMLSEVFTFKISKRVAAVTHTRFK